MSFMFILDAVENMKHSGHEATLSRQGNGQKVIRTAACAAAGVSKMSMKCSKTGCVCSSKGGDEKRVTI